MLGRTRNTPASTQTPRSHCSAVRHLTQRELADRWRISARTLERWRWVGQGPSYLKIGGSVAYRMADVEAFEAAQRRVAGLR